MQPLLLDTCAVIWIAEDEKLAPEAIAAIDAAYQAEVPTYARR